MESEEVEAALRESRHWGLRSGVNGTPTLYVNGVRYEGEACPVREAELRAALADAG
jgi:protein-disulfide isomerase